MISTRAGAGRQRGLLVSEVFSAIQGEGALVGHRQVFVRLTGCNIRCAYCDQPEALESRPGPCRLEQAPGLRDWSWRPSPLAPGEVAGAVARLWQGLPHHSVSITGGEPLLQAGRLRRLLPLLAGAGQAVMLETNGTRPGALAQVLEWVDVVSMDLKLDSVDGQGVDLDTHRRFLELARARAVYVKVVLGPTTSDLELSLALAMVAETAPGCSVFLQPVTPFAAVTQSPSPAQVLGWQALALRIHPGVRVVPQTHKAIGQL